MRRIVVAAKAGADQPWLAEAAAEIAGQQGATVDVVSADGVDIEAFSTIPREEAAGPPRDAAEAMAEQIRAAGAAVPDGLAPFRPSGKSTGAKASVTDGFAPLDSGGGAYWTEAVTDARLPTSLPSRS